MTIDRRKFLRHIAASGAAVSFPAFLQGCVSEPVVVIDEPSPDNLFANWFGIDRASIGKVTSALTARGADFADTFFEVSARNRIVYRDGAVSEISADMHQGAGLRVVRGEDVGFAYTEDLALPALLIAARNVAGTTGNEPPLPVEVRLADSGDLYLMDTPWNTVATERKLGILASIEQQARAADSSVESVTIRWDDAEDNIMIATGEGDLVTDTRPMARLTLIVTAVKGGARQTGFATIAARRDVDWLGGERQAELVKTAVERTLIQFEARRAPQGDMPVILAAGTGGILLHEALGHSFEADLVANRTSAYADKLGSQVAESVVTIIDDARMPHESGALNFDDEGTETGRTVLIENGVLKSFVHDRTTARQFGVESTGSGRRQSFRHLPMPRLTCTYMDNGPHSRNEIIAAVGDGVICETFSRGNVQPGGAFGFDVKNGWLIEKGRIVAPTKDFRIAGNGPDLLSRITMVGNDLRMDAGGWICGKNGQNVPVSQGMPTVLVSGLTVA